MASPGDKTFRVLIVGGGVAGLTLANMLEKFDIDYLVLEAHGDIAPQVGASIGIFPNGMRILDQLDCYEALEKFKVTNDMFVHDESGKPLVTLPDIQKHVLHRHGYPLVFFDRQWLLQILFDHLQKKDRVLLNQKVEQVKQIRGGVEITTANGRKFTGSLVVGADGLHSAVRQEMYRIGNKLEPGYFPKDEEERVPCHYICSFGIAQNVPGWVPNTQYTVIGKGHSQLAISGPQERIYWFFFSKLADTKYGQDIPRFTKEMEAQFVAEHAHIPITQKVTFGQVYAKRLTSTLTPLHEFVRKRWYFGRMLIFGDSAHKPNPIGGQGGNGAIESAAEFVNALLRKKEKKSGSLAGLTDRDVQDVFEEMQTARHRRAEKIVDSSHFQQALEAYEKPLTSKLIWKYLSPHMGNEAFLSRSVGTQEGAARLERLPIKRRPRAIPFKDELPAPPLRKGRPFQIALIAMMTCLLIIAIRPWYAPLLTLDICEAAEISGICVPALNAFGAFRSQQLQSFSKVGDGHEHQIFGLYLSSQLTAPILIYTIEGYRLGNAGTILALPSLFLFAMQVGRLGKVAPIYAIFSALFSYDLPTGRFVRPEVAKSLIPALTLGYMLPIILPMLFASSTESWHTWTSIWQFSPLLVSTLTYVFASVVRYWKQARMTPQEKRDSEFDRYRCQDAPVLRLVYGYAFIVQAISHFALLHYAYRHPESLYSPMLSSLRHLLQSRWDMNNVGPQVSALLNHDLVVAVASWALSNFYSAWNLRRLGYINTRDTFVSMLGVIAGQGLVGPGATWTGLWHWREGVFLALKRE